MVFAHGIGGAKDLPIPAEYAMAGAGAALAVSFIVLALAWRTPRFDAATKGTPAPAWLASVVDSTWFAALLRVARPGVLRVRRLGRRGRSGPAAEPHVRGRLRAALGRRSCRRPCCSDRSTGRSARCARSTCSSRGSTGGDPERGLLTLPRWVGYWPAALGLLAFVWLELVYPGSTYLSPVRLWFAAYLAIVLVGSAVFGSAWLERADPFEVYSTLVGHLSVFGRTADGTLVLRSPLGNLDGVRVEPGLVGVVAVLFGSTAFDSFKDSTEWLQFTQSSSAELDVAGPRWPCCSSCSSSA